MYNKIVGKLLLSYILLIVMLVILGLSCNNGVNNNLSTSKYSKSNLAKHLLVNKKFIEALLDKNNQDSTRIKNAFFSMKIFEPILFGITIGDYSHKLKYTNASGGDFSKFYYTSNKTYYTYSLQNTENILNIELPSNPKKIVNEWSNNDTTFYQSLQGYYEGLITESLYFYIDKNKDTISHPSKTF